MDIDRSDIHLVADASRVVTRPFFPGGPDRIRAIVARLLAIPEQDVLELLSGVLHDFSHRHRNLHCSYNRHP